MEINENQKEKILIVDDTPANIDVLGAILMDDYDISVAVTGAMALDIARSKNPPDLILLDIMMPEMDGYEVAQKLKSDHATSQIPIIFVTAKIEDSDEAFGFELGAVDYIRKPVTPKVAMARIKSQLELKNYRDRLAQLLEEKSGQVEKSQKELNLVTEDLMDKKITAHKNQVYFRELFMNSPYGIILVGKDKRIIRSNRSFSKLLGYPMDEIMNTRFSGFSEDEKNRELHEGMIESALQGQTLSIEIPCRHRQGYHVPVSALAYPVKIKTDVQGVFIFYENISQRKLFEEKLKHQAYHDALTGIPNRLLFSERLDYAIRRKAKDTDYQFSVLLIDLDRFKQVNDSLGHQAGDELLQRVTEKIRECLRARDTLARLGGDEFAVLLPEIASKPQITTIANRIKDAAESTFLIQDQEVHISASIGIVMDSNGYDDANHLLRDADLAMYTAKDCGKAQFQFFTPKMHEALLETLSIEKGLRAAIENNDLALFFQPIVQVSSQKTKGFEALVRWQHPEKGLIPPDRFITVAEETGLILPMGEWIIETACEKLSLWKKQFNRHLTMHINISIRQFLSRDFFQHLIRTVETHKLAPSDIRLEFTESLLMEHTRSAVEKLHQLKDTGFVLSIDDFGTGYSSLSYLQQFPIDQIKIDRSFISSMEPGNDSHEIVRSILSLSRSLKLSTVAEGVENRAQLEMLSELSCDSAQGYYFSKPMDPKQTRAYLSY